MKKVFLTLALVAFAVASNAQIILGGQFNFYTNGGTYTQENASPVWNSPNNKSMNFTIAPTISYVLNDNMQVGLGIQYNINSTTNFTQWAYANDLETWNKNTGSFFAIAPYFRYYFANFNKFNFFCEATLTYGIDPRDKNHDYSNDPLFSYDDEYDGTGKITTVSFTVVPGVNYKINDHWSADCFIDLAGIGYYNRTIKTYAGFGAPDPDELVSTDKFNDFSFFGNASSETIWNQLNNFRIGFNYHF